LLFVAAWATRLDRDFQASDYTESHTSHLVEKLLS
jgi:hypothetical protein